LAGCEWLAVNLLAAFGRVAKCSEEAVAGPLRSLFPAVTFRLGRPLATGPPANQGIKAEANASLGGNE